VDDIKYLWSYIESTEHDIEVRIGLAWAAFAKLKSIFRSPKLKIEFKIRILKAACFSILLYGCESWILTAATTDKLDIFARACYRIILGICQSTDHVTNKELYERVDKKVTITIYWPLSSNGRGRARTVEEQIEFEQSFFH